MAPGGGWPKSSGTALSELPVRLGRYSRGACLTLILPYAKSIILPAIVIS